MKYPLNLFLVWSRRNPQRIQGCWRTRQESWCRRCQTCRRTPSRTRTLSAHRPSSSRTRTTNQGNSSPSRWGRTSCPQGRQEDHCQAWTTSTWTRIRTRFRTASLPRSQQEPRQGRPSSQRTPVPGRWRQEELRETPRPRRQTPEQTQGPEETTRRGWRTRQPQPSEVPSSPTPSRKFLSIYAYCGRVQIDDLFNSRKKQNPAQTKLNNPSPDSAPSLVPPPALLQAVSRLLNLLLSSALLLDPVSATTIKLLDPLVLVF